MLPSILSQVGRLLPTLASPILFLTLGISFTQSCRNYEAKENSKILRQKAGGRGEKERANRQIFFGAEYILPKTGNNPKCLSTEE